jgi:hypothetical protein
MSIKWKKKVRNADGKDIWVDDGETHVGLVMTSRVEKVEKVMSDIYADVSSCVVWNPEKGTVESVRLGSNFELETRYGTATVDIDPKIQAECDAKAAAAEAARKKAEGERIEREAEERARDAVIGPAPGVEVVVVRGRKVPHGTRGVVFHEGDGKYGPRVGFMDAAGKKHWTSTSNVVGVLPGREPGDRPACGWRTLRDMIQTARDAWRKTWPVKGDKVRHLASGIVGNVIWVRDERLGMKRDRASKDEDPTWGDAWEFAVIEAGGRERIVTSAFVMPSYEVIPAKAEAPTSGPKTFTEGYADFGLGSEPEPHPLSGLPEPYCRIRSVSYEEEWGRWEAKDENDNFVVVLTEKGAADLLRKLEVTINNLGGVREVIHGAKTINAEKKP